MSRPVVLVLPEGPLYRDLFPSPVRTSLAAFAEVRERPDGDGKWPAERFHAALSGVDAALTGWGSPRFDAAAVDAAPRLRIVGHAAGTIKGIGSPQLFERGIAVVNAHDAVAPYVGEMALAMTLSALRQLPAHDRAMRAERTWGARGVVPETLFGRRVGLVGLGATARALLTVLSPFRCEILASDPNVDARAAAALGVRLVPLEQLLAACDIVSLHAASLPETRHLLDRGRLALLPDGALLVNTARGSLVDSDALADELRAGRLRAVLDVTEPEPLSADHPFRDMPNVSLTPHISGPTPGRRHEMAAMVIDDLRRFFNGEPVLHPASPVGLQMD